MSNVVGLDLLVVSSAAPTWCTRRHCSVDTRADRGRSHLFLDACWVSGWVTYLSFTRGPILPHALAQRPKP
ncbi:hypothetical protein F4782DRAFT_160795 [Xylaria castorea]|nr:hypothetical protein F4782DRAFT_160795 [Xylaria castorea]